MTIRKRIESSVFFVHFIVFTALSVLIYFHPSSYNLVQKRNIIQVYHFNDSALQEFNLDSLLEDYKNFHYPPLKLEIDETRSSMLDPNSDSLSRYLISEGAFIYHNGSAPSITKNFDLYGYPVQVTTFFNTGWKEYVLELPPFLWKKPLGLSPKMEALFWKQPENHMHFKDTNKIHRCVIWEIENASKIFKGCPNYVQTHHLKTCAIPEPYSVAKPRYNYGFTLTGGEISSFQHFFDNGIPVFASSQIATNFSDDIDFYCDNYINIIKDLFSRMGYNHKQSDERGFSAKHLIQNHVNAVVHPLYFEWYRRKANFPEFPKSERTKVILLDRNSKGNNKRERIIENFLELVPHLEKIHGKENVIVFNKRDYSSLDSLINLFGKAKFILGPHGGAFYNQFFAPKNIDVIELFPIKKSGLYLTQDDFSLLPRFAPLAVWSNTQLLGQKHWRYYYFTNKQVASIDISDFLQWGKQIPGFLSKDP